MKMKLMQILLVVAAVLCAIGIAVALTGGEVRDAEAYEPSGLMRSLGGLIGPPALAPEELTRQGTAFPASLRLEPGVRKTFEISSSRAEQRRAAFEISGRSAAFTISYKVDDNQHFNGRPVDNRQWRQAEADKPHEVRFVIFDRGGELTFSNSGDPSTGVTLRMEE